MDTPKSETINYSFGHWTVAHGRQILRIHIGSLVQLYLQRADQRRDTTCIAIGLRTMFRHSMIASSGHVSLELRSGLTWHVVDSLTKLTRMETTNSLPKSVLIVDHQAPVPP